MKKRLLAGLLTGVILCSVLASCSGKPGEKVDATFAYLISTQEELETAQLLESQAEKNSNAESTESDYISVNGKVAYFQGLTRASDAMLAFTTGKVDGLYIPLCVAEYLMEDGADQKLVEDTWTSVFQLGALPANSELIEQMNQLIDQWQADGTLAALEETYLQGSSAKKQPAPIPMPHFEGRPTIKIAVTGSIPPLDYISADGIPAGFNVALSTELSKALEVNIELVPVDAEARIAALATGKVDFLFWIGSSNEAMQSTDALLFSHPYYTVKSAYLTNAAHYEFAQDIASLS